MSEAAESSASQMAARLGPVRVGLRTDLRFHRHLFRGEASYVARDPVSMACHQFSADDYQVVAMISERRSLADTFTALCDREVLEAEDEERFYDFIVSLHQLGFLQLPISDDKALYRRFLAKQAARWRQKVSGFLFLQVPLINPDAFLNRTAHLVRPLFSRWFFGIYLLLMAVAGAVAVGHWRELVAPAHNFFGAKNVWVMFFTLIGLKVVHEFGHAYACKLRGGVVPEMGAFMVVFAPLAYVDATSAWGFTRRKDRLIVSLAGMYVETFIAALAVLVWATTGSAQTKILAHNVLTLAGLVTVLMNANPLMRFDGYYILSDWLEVPNLRQRSQGYVVNVLKRVIFGRSVLKDGCEVERTGDRGDPGWLLFGYGVGSAVYKLTIVLSISAVIASRMYFVGIALAGFYVFGIVFKLLKGVTTYLWHSPEVAGYRWRAVGLSVLLLAALPAVVLLVPLPSTVRASGVFAREHEVVVRSAHDGFVEAVGVRQGQAVDAGALLAVVVNPSLDRALIEAQGEREAALLRARAWRETDAGRAMAEWKVARALGAEVARRAELRDRQRVVADESGYVIESLSKGDIGKFVVKGEAVARLVSGGWQVRALLSEDDLAAANPVVGQVVEVRAARDPGVVMKGTVMAIVPTGTREIGLAALTQLGGGDIPVRAGVGAKADGGDGVGARSDRPFFEMVLKVDGVEGDEVLGAGYEGTVSVRLPGPREPLGRMVQRRVLRLLQTIRSTN